MRFTWSVSLRVVVCWFIYYFWLRWVFVAVCRLSLVAASQDYSSLPCTGSSLQWLLLLQSRGSRSIGFSSCSSQVKLLWGLWDLPRPETKPVSPALAGGFLSTLPLGKSQVYLLWIMLLVSNLRTFAAPSSQIFPYFSSRCHIVLHLSP